MSELINSEKIVQNTYKAARDSVINAQNKVYAVVKNAIYKACGDNDRAEYSKGLIKYIADQLTRESGKGFDERNLRKMRQFYCAYPIRDSL